jgi:transcriptional regulator with XRE-family HTH domain
MSDTLAVIVGAELRRLRRRELMTQADVARALKLPRPVISRRERGLHLPTVDRLEAQARVCGGSIGHLLIQLDLATGALRPGGGR